MLKRFKIQVSRLNELFRYAHICFKILDTIHDFALKSSVELIMLPLLTSLI